MMTNREYAKSILTQYSPLDVTLLTAAQLEELPFLLHGLLTYGQQKKDAAVLSLAEKLLADCKYFWQEKLTAAENDLSDFGWGQVILELAQLTGDETLCAYSRQWGEKLTQFPRLTTGNFACSTENAQTLTLKSLYPTLPFYMNFEAFLHKNLNYRDIYLQLQKATQLLADFQTGLLCASYQELSLDTVKLKRQFPSLSAAFYALALVETVDFVDERFYLELEMPQQLLNQFLRTVLTYQNQESQLFHELLPDQTSPVDLSASCALAYVLMKGSQKQYLPKKAAGLGAKIFTAVLAQCSATRSQEILLDALGLLAASFYEEKESGWRTR